MYNIFKKMSVVLLMIFVIPISEASAEKVFVYEGYFTGNAGGYTLNRENIPKIPYKFYIHTDMINIWYDNGIEMIDVGVTIEKKGKEKSYVYRFRPESDSRTSDDTPYRYCQKSMRSKTWGMVWYPVTKYSNLITVISMARQYAK